MRRFGRRRKPRVQWMRNIGQPTNHATTAGDVSVDNSGIEFPIAVTATDPVTFLFGMVRDNPTDVAELGAPHAVLDKFSINQDATYGWRLRRVVGKLFLSAGFTRSQDQDVPPDGVLVSAGIIVRRVDDSGSPVASGVDQDVSSLANNTDPWLWRRDWILGFGDSFPNNGTTTVNTRGIRNFPPTNAHYGSVKDGPHIDQKTNRIIGAEERLFLNITCYCLPFNVAPVTFTALPFVNLNFQYRCLGTVFSNVGNRRNAVR